MGGDCNEILSSLDMFNFYDVQKSPEICILSNGIEVSEEKWDIANLVTK